MHTQNNLVFLAIRLPENSNEIIKTNLTRRWIFEKVFEKTVFIKNVFENQLHKQGPTGRANLFSCVFGKLRASSDYHKRDQTRDLRSMLCKGFDRKKGFEKDHEMHSGYLESRTGLETKRHCLSTSLRLQSKAI